MENQNQNQNQNDDIQQVTNLLMHQLKTLGDQENPTKEQLEKSKTMVTVGRQILDNKKFELDVIKHVHSKPIVVVHDDGEITCSDPGITIKRLDSVGLNSEVKQLNSNED